MSRERSLLSRSAVQCRCAAASFRRTPPNDTSPDDAFEGARQPGKVRNCPEISPLPAEFKTLPQRWRTERQPRRDSVAQRCIAPCTENRGLCSPVDKPQDCGHRSRKAQTLQGVKSQMDTGWVRGIFQIGQIPVAFFLQLRRVCNGIGESVTVACRNSRNAF